jgi:hypothetical protein
MSPSGAGEIKPFFSILRKRKDSAEKAPGPAARAVEPTFDSRRHILKGEGLSAFCADLDQGSGFYVDLGNDVSVHLRKEY